MARKLISNKSRLSLLLAVLFFGLLLSCAFVQLNQNGWKVLPDVKKATLTISHVDLGLVVKDVQLFLKEEEGLSALSDWSVMKEQDELIITTNKPNSTTWNFKINEQGLNISCSANNGVLLGVAPACDERIPARVESQDNGILYTSIGSVSAKKLCCLFDRETDIMIQFSEASDLSRNATDEKLMDVTFPIAEGAEISLIPDYYINELGLKYYQPIPKRFKTAPVCWSSWYCYYMGTTEADVMTETDALAKYLKPYGLEYVQLDACYTRGDDANYLDWTKKTFPHGGKWLFQYITSKGLKPALWVNIYGSNYAKAECTDKYPDNYYLRDKNGKLSGACCTADTTVVRLDYTNPEVIEKHLKPMFKTLVEDWGTKYLKDAGCGTWMDN